MKTPENQNKIELNLQQPVIIQENISNERAIESLENFVSNQEISFNQNNEIYIDRVRNYPGACESDIEETQNINDEASLEMKKAEIRLKNEILKLNIDASRGIDISNTKEIETQETQDPINEKSKEKESVDVLPQNISNLSEEEISESIVEFNKNNSEKPKSSQYESINYNKNIEFLSENKNIDTTQVFCIVDSKGLSKDKKREIFDNPENWDESRKLLHERLRTENIQLSLNLSKRLESENPKIPPPTIFALRGSPGAGKTTSLRRGHEMFKGILDENGQPSGSLAPDVFKVPLKDGGNLSSDQVHAESTMLGRAVKKEVSNANTSIVFDKLMNENADIEEMIESAKETNRKITIMDIDVPLELSAVRVLGREKGGADPNIRFDGVAQGFRGIRQNREAQHKLLDDNSQLVNGYVLMAYDKESQQSVEIAMWDEESGKVRIVEGRENLASQSIEDPEEEVERVTNTFITEEYIKFFTTTYFDEKSQQFAEKTAQTLRQYLGKTISMALDEKAQ